jgi:hypothetical protein
MGNRGDVYERYYMPNFADKDCLAIFLGTTRRDDLLRAVGRLERHSGAPDDLNDAQRAEIRNHPELIELARCRERYVAKIKQYGYLTMKAAKGTKWFERRGEAQCYINSLRTKLYREKLDKIIDEFHETVHTEEVDRQIQGIVPSPANLNSLTIEYELEERATVARLLFQPLDDLKLDQMFRVRVQLVQALVELCKRQETPHQFKKSTKTPRPVEAADIPMDMDHSAPSTSQLLVDAVVHAADPNHGTDGPNEKPVTPDLFCPLLQVGR